MYKKPLAYFITFTTYGTWLHCDSRGSVIIERHTPKQLIPSEHFYLHQQQQLKYPCVALDAVQRKIVLQTVISHCTIKNWRLYAAHIRSNHVDILAASDEKADKVMNELKAWATRKMRQAHYTMPKVWTQHGSTQFVFTQSKLKEKARYIICEQGEKMEYYYDEFLSECVTQ